MATEEVARPVRAYVVLHEDVAHVLDVVARGIAAHVRQALV